MAVRIDQARGRARPAQRAVEQIVRGEQLAVPHEQVAHRRATELVHEGALDPVRSQGGDGLQRHGGVLVQRDHTLAVGLASGQA
jgi:hypothetical protein